MSVCVCCRPQSVICCPFYHTACQNAMLYCADCFDVLEKLDITADAVISDPPYGISNCQWDCRITSLQLLSSS